MTSPDYARLFSVLDLLAEDCVRLCVFGDLNLPLLNWDLFIYPDSHLYCTATNLICNHGLTQLVNDPTRGMSILDLILCSDILCCDNVNVLPPLANSDHSVVSCSLYISLPHSTAGDCDYVSFILRPTGLGCVIIRHQLIGLLSLAVALPSVSSGIFFCILSSWE